MPQQPWSRVPIPPSSLILCLTLLSFPKLAYTSFHYGVTSRWAFLLFFTFFYWLSFIFSLSLTCLLEPLFSSHINLLHFPLPSLPRLLVVSPFPNTPSLIIASLPDSQHSQSPVITRWSGYTSKQHLKELHKERCNNVIWDFYVDFIPKLCQRLLPTYEFFILQISLFLFCVCLWRLHSLKTIVVNICHGSGTRNTNISLLLNIVKYIRLSTSSSWNHRSELLRGTFHSEAEGVAEEIEPFKYSFWDPPELKSFRECRVLYNCRSFGFSCYISFSSSREESQDTLLLLDYWSFTQVMVGADRWLTMAIEKKCIHSPLNRSLSITTTPCR